MNVSLRIILNLAIVVVFALPVGAATVSIETFKDNTVFRDSPNDVGDTTNGGGNNSELDINFNELSYTAFDLSSLPSGAVITSAKIGVYDKRTSRARTVYVGLADVADDWNETTLTWNIAAASYGATTGSDQSDTDSLNSNTAMINTSDLLWSGQIYMNADPGFIWAESRTDSLLYSGADTYHGGVSWTDTELVSGLNNILGGDQVAVFAFSTPAGRNQYISERNDPDHEGVTLEITYAVPEPSSLGLGLLSLFAIAAISRRKK